jgi:type II secretory pathway pseudopilin PulG
MSFAIVLIVLGLVLFAASVLGPRYFSSEAKAERRRRRSNRRISSKNRQPTVKFSVHTDKKEDK